MAKIRITGVTNVDYLILAWTLILAIALTHADRRTKVYDGIRGIAPDPNAG